MTPIKHQLQALTASFKNAEFINPGETVGHTPHRGSPGSRLSDFLTTGKVKWKTTGGVNSKKGPFRKDVFLIVVDGEGCVCLINQHGQVFITDTDNQLIHKGETYVDYLDLCAQDKIPRPVPDAQLIPSIYQGETFDCIINADESLDLGNDNFDSQTAFSGGRKLNVEGQPSMSFTALGRFLNAHGCAGTKALLDGRATIIDWSPDEHRTTTAAVQKKLKEERNRLDKVGSYLNSSQGIASSLGIKPPEPGYYMIRATCWHRSGCVVVQMTIGSRQPYFLFGVDDDSYFGCELPHKVTSVKEAYDSLVPPVLRGKAIDRQGEWFFELIESGVPKVTQCAAFCNVQQPDWNGKPQNIIDHASISMPKETDDSNTHTVLCKEWRLVRKNGYVIYALDPTMRQSEHQDVSARGWVRFHKNLAIRSVSVAGVD